MELIQLRDGLGGGTVWRATWRGVSARCHDVRDAIAACAYRVGLTL